MNSSSAAVKVDAHESRTGSIGTLEYKAYVSVAIHLVSLVHSLTVDYQHSTCNRCVQRLPWISAMTQTVTTMAYWTGLFSKAKQFF